MESCRGFLFKKSALTLVYYCFVLRVSVSASIHEQNLQGIKTNHGQKSKQGGFMKEAILITNYHGEYNFNSNKQLGNNFKGTNQFKIPINPNLSHMDTKAEIKNTVRFFDVLAELAIIGALENDRSGFSKLKNMGTHKLLSGNACANFHQSLTTRCIDFWSDFTWLHVKLIKWEYLRQPLGYENVAVVCDWLNDFVRQTDILFAANQKPTLAIGRRLSWLQDHLHVVFHNITYLENSEYDAEFSQILNKIERLRCGLQETSGITEESRAQGQQIEMQSSRLEKLFTAAGNSYTMRRLRDQLFLTTLDVYFSKIVTQLPNLIDCNALQHHQNWQNTILDVQQQFQRNWPSCFDENNYTVK